ncbi:hypothetical protein Bca52824_046212 [Brassica carinata]|uniref:F-box domain-containing protein n=1 Tax=Brassica carinata TaxID=52824 RepID=A0A8X7RGQ3_BRACI|nr:hypothetical protein Bca52824_046212 [Brassica carinata]
MCSASNPEQPPPQKDNHLLSLPEDIVLSCLARVPRNCNLNLTHVSKTLRTFVSSPELNRLRSLLPKSSLYVCFYEINDNATWTHRWLTLEKTTTEYRLVLFPCQHCPFMDRSLAASVGSEIYFLWKHLRYPSDLWILDTRSGKLSLGPSMKAVLRSEAILTRRSKYVFDPKSKIWKSEGQEKVPPRKWYNNTYNIAASLERKIYMVKDGITSVYNPREVEGERMDHMRRQKKKKLNEGVEWVCVVENVLYACYCSSGLMWFDTKLNVWRRVVSRYAEEACHFGEQQAVAEYEGKLAVFEFVNHDLVNNTESVKMFLFSFHRAGERILGTMDWLGVVATVPFGSQFLHCSGM